MCVCTYIVLTHVLNSCAICCSGGDEGIFTEDGEGYEDDYDESQAGYQQQQSLRQQQVPRPGQMSMRQQQQQQDAEPDVPGSQAPAAKSGLRKWFG